MKAKFLFLFGSLFLSLTGLTQTTGYYYKGQPKSVIFSTRIIFVHFVSGLTNAQKQSVISDASLDLLNSNFSSIPDYVKLQSRMVSGWHWVYPCIVESKPSTLEDTANVDPNIVQLPCEGCPDCTPRWEYYEYNNFSNALYSLSNNANVRAVSKGFSSSASIVATVGTNENFYIKIKSNYSISNFTSLLTNYSFVAQDESMNFGNKVYKISVNRDKSTDLMGWANVFYNTGMCEYATPNFLEIGKIADSNDPRWNEQWGLLNTGQYNGIAGADIRVVNAWQFSKGSNVKVAVIDDGALINHPDLQANYLPGFDAVPGSTYFEGWHGTEVAGIIGAIANNNIDISGVAPESKIIPVKIYTASDNAGDIGSADQTVRGINWAVDAGAEILNCSWGKDFESDMIDIAITDAITFGRNGKGCIVVFSSGNDNNEKLKYPSSTHPDVIAVGAMTHCNSRKSYNSCDPNDGFATSEFNHWGSNFGTNLSLVAPGCRIPTVTIDNYNITNLSGTSAAAPMVSGVAALMLAINPNLTQIQARKIIELSSNKVGSYCYNWTSSHSNGAWTNEMGYGRLNAYNAVQLARLGVTISNPTYNIASQTSTAVTGNIAIIFNGMACPTYLPFGVAFVRRHEVKTNITYPNTLNPVIICSSNGFTQANPNDGRHWAEAINVTNTSATLRTYVYYGYNAIGQELGWIPTAPTNINFSYVVVGSPTNIDYQFLQNRATTGNADSINKIPFELDFSEDIIVNDVQFEVTKNAITPNPVGNLLVLHIESEATKTENIEIVNSVGIKVKQILSKRINKGANVLSIDVQSMIKGMYLLKCGAKTYKFIKN